MHDHDGLDIQLRGGTAAEWTTKNPVLMVRETGWETDTRRVKLGDGVTPWVSLPYAADEAAQVAVVAAALAALDAIAVKDGDGAGGVLSGAYPNPGFAVDMAEQSEVDNALALKVAKAGDTMTGKLIVSRAAADMLELFRSDNGVGNKRWKVNVQTNGDVTFDLYSDADAFVATLLRIQRSGLGGAIGGSQFINFGGSPEGVFSAGIGTRYIDTSAAGGLIEYIKTTASGTTGWVALDAGKTSTTAALTAIGNAINTTGKTTGKSVFNTTTSKPVWAVGSTAGSVWVDATGATVHTPV